MTAPSSIDALKVCLETLQLDAKRQQLPLVATLIGAACEALGDEVAARNAPIEEFARQHA